MRAVDPKDLTALNSCGIPTPQVLKEPVHVPALKIKLLGTVQKPTSINRARAYAKYSCDICGKTYVKLPTLVMEDLRQRKIGCAACRQKERQTVQRHKGYGEWKDCPLPFPQRRVPALHPANLAWRVR